MKDNDHEVSFGKYFWEIQTKGFNYQNTKSYFKIRVLVSTSNFTDLVLFIKMNKLFEANMMY